MIQLTRRDLLAGTAATTAALSMGLTPSELRAAAPAAGKQAPGFYRYKVGDFEVTQIADGARTFPMPDTFVVNQKKEDALAAAEAAYMPKGQVTIPFNPMVINTGSKLVVIDTGNGLGAFEQSKGVVGQMNANMTAAGIDPKNDIVVISHFHGDHMNGLKKADGSLVYPSAEIMVPAAEWAFWADEANASKANGFNKPNFANVKKAFDGLADKVTKFEAGKDIAPGITSIAAPGHTPGHVVLFEPNERKVFVGDCLFAGSIGRTDLPGGSSEQLMDSLFNKIVPLGDDVEVYSGHGPVTTIGHERRTNPFLTGVYSIGSSGRL